MNAEQYWQVVLERDQQFDGIFVYAVRSTGIYCRPSCPSRRPRREYVSFFQRNEEAERHGYRACRRCRPQELTPTEPYLGMVAKLCRYLEQEHIGVPTLATLAAGFNLSPYYMQRTFKRIVGVTPRQYADACRRRRLRAHLRAGRPVSEALYQAGYGSSSQFYEEAAAFLGMAPATYQNGGSAMIIRYTVVPCALGHLLIAATERGVCTISLGEAPAPLVQALAAEYPAAAIQQDATGLEVWASQLLQHIDGRRPQLDLPLDIQATAFQRQVWEALRTIPYGSTRSYSEVAHELERPQAARAIARACATNPVALAIPCHRVVRSDGELSGYRWGIERKQVLLERERAATPLAAEEPAAESAQVADE